MQSFNYSRALDATPHAQEKMALQDVQSACLTIYCGYVSSIVYWKFNRAAPSLPGRNPNLLFLSLEA